jgi:iron(III) transport system ATP-binding protein
VTELRVLLLDEPLANLDAKLRERARIWLRQFQQQMGITAVYVTHDQSEARALSDRIIVMNGGRISQTGTPTEIYDRPANPFVADFVGASNLLTCTIVAAAPSGCKVKLSSGDIIDVVGRRADQTTGQIMMSVRSERILIAPSDVSPTPNAVNAAITRISYQGARFTLIAEFGTDQIRIESSTLPPAGPVKLLFPFDSVRLFPTAQR